MGKFYRWQDDDLILQIKVNAGSSVNKLLCETDVVKLKITTPPIDGKANKHLARYLANVFAVSPSKITIPKGENRSTKILSIINPIALPGFITR